MIAWTGLRMDAKKTRAFRIKLAFDKCAGGDPVPSKHAKANATLFDGTLGVATFTGPVDTPSCLVAKDVVVRGGRRGEGGRTLMALMNRFAKWEGEV